MSQYFQIEAMVPWVKYVLGSATNVVINEMPKKFTTEATVRLSILAHENIGLPYNYSFLSGSDMVQVTQMSNEVQVAVDIFRPLSFANDELFDATNRANQFCALAKSEPSIQWFEQNAPGYGLRDIGPISSLYFDADRTIQRANFTLFFHFNSHYIHEGFEQTTIQSGSYQISFEDEGVTIEENWSFPDEVDDE
jgi:hypothetical protein